MIKGLKQLITIIFSMVLFTQIQAQKSIEAASELTVKEATYDFGKIPQGKPVYHLFTVINSSTKPIKLSNVQASCGCTTPEWSREEIAPGANSTIKVGFNAMTEGAFEKFITILYNDNQSQQISIKGEVWKA